MTPQKLTPTKLQKMLTDLESELIECTISTNNHPHGTFKFTT